MDDSSQPTMPSPIPEPTEVPPPTPPPSSPRMKLEIIAAILVVVLGALLLLGLRFLSSQRTTPPALVQTALPTPTPTPTRLPSALATQSAFLKLEANVASLSGAIKNYVVDDPSLSPPILALPLGFQ